MTQHTYEEGAKAPCPHCGTTVQLLAPAEYSADRTQHSVRRGDVSLRGGAGFGPSVRFSECPACQTVIVQLELDDRHWLAYPRTATRNPVHFSVPGELRVDYEEAALVLNDSPKASAALARRCLFAGPEYGRFAAQLDEVLPDLPAYVGSSVDNIRKLGNLSAHAKESRATGGILDVKAGEAEWMLEVLEQLFDHYYAKPAETKARNEALQRKFADAGRVTPAPDGS